MPDVATPPKDPRLIEAEIAVAEANARKASAEATAAQVKALIPDLPKEVTAGALATPEAPAPIATVAAYRALSEVAGAIADELHLPGTGAIWIVPDGGFQTAIDVHDSLEAQLELLATLATNAVHEIKPPAEPVPPDKEPEPGERSLALALGAELAATAAPLVMSLFSTSRTMTTAEVPVAFAAAAATVASAVEKRAASSAPDEVDVYVWGITPPPTADPQVAITRLQDARNGLEEALVEARGTSATSSTEASAVAEAEAWKAALDHLVELDLAKAADIVKAIAGAVGRATDERNRKARSGEVIKSCEQLLQTIDEVLHLVTGSPGAALAAQSAQGAALKGAHVLVLQPTYTGAESIYEDVKLKRDRALHVGSSVMSWYLLDTDHKLVKSGIESAHASGTTKVGLPEVTWE